MVIGASGFIGRAVLGAAASAAIDVVPLSGLRLDGSDGVTVDDLSAVVLDKLGTREADKLAESLEGADVVVNAAGLARPDSLDSADLIAANAVLPALLAALASGLGVRRFVQISSAAVQGRLSPLDETTKVLPFSPYSRSKALGEQLLWEADLSPMEIVVYRPTSVHGQGRPATEALVRQARRLPVLPIVGHGKLPLPVASIDNVAAAVIHLATCDSPPSVVLHPWEGITQAEFWRMLNPGVRFVSVPAPAMRLAVNFLNRAGGWFPRIDGPVRRLEVCMLGQQIVALGLEESGFSLENRDGWLQRQLADEQAE